MSGIVEIFTDGACRGNPGPGGWGVILRYRGHEKTLYGAEAHTTNNRMELMAAIKGLEQMKRSCDIHLTTDSQYVQKGVSEWLPRWQKNHWRNKEGKAIKNQDLWVHLAELIQPHQIKWFWVKGHSNHPENERCDQLANQAIDEFLARK